MSSLENIAVKNAEKYRRQFINEGFNASEIEKQKYAYSFQIEEKAKKIKLLIYFGKKGIKPVIQGDRNELYSKVYYIVFGDKLLSHQNEFKEPDEYIGTDESGKGDYFGPLVTAGVIVSKSAKVELSKIGVRDSKDLSDGSIKKIAAQIKNIIKNNFEVVRINPEKYNALYNKMMNVNLLLGWAHARVIENLLLENDVDVAISDKFGNEKTILNSLMEKGKIIKLHQETKAEKYIGVAAASILARAEMLRWFENKSKELHYKIPKGASGKVELAAIELKNKLGDAEMKKLIKLHFKTSKKIFN